MKWKILIVAALIVGAAVGYKFYTDEIVAETVQTYETVKVMRMDFDENRFCDGHRSAA